MWEEGTPLQVMDRILSWNVRGLNSPNKQVDVKKFIQHHSVGLVGLLETKVKASNLGSLYQRVFSGWCFSSNSAFHDGGRVVIAWKPGIFSVNILQASSQAIHCYVSPVSGLPSFFCTFVYGFNKPYQRKELWEFIKQKNTQEPWLLCGDLNCVMHVDERIGAPLRRREIESITQCMNECNMVDVKSTGSLFTWNNKQLGEARVYSKIDRIMANQAWQTHYCNAEVGYLNEGLFDHTPALLTVYTREKSGRKPFKYFTMWRHSDQFHSKVAEAWQTTIRGTKMFSVVQRLKYTKQALKELNRNGFSEVQAADAKAFQDMQEAQELMHANHCNHSVCDAELRAISEYKMKHKVYTEFLRQKSKLAWLREGDENTTFFHKIIKARSIQNQVYAIYDKHGVWQNTDSGVTQAFLDFYQELLGTTHQHRKKVIRQIVHSGPLVTDTHK